MIPSQRHPEFSVKKKSRRTMRRPSDLPENYATLTIVRRHLVHNTLVSFRFPCQTAARWRLGLKDRCVARFENDRL
jgi:hypothetical protein